MADSIKDLIIGVAETAQSAVKTKATGWHLPPCNYFKCHSERSEESHSPYEGIRFLEFIYSYSSS